DRHGDRPGHRADSGGTQRRRQPVLGGGTKRRPHPEVVRALRDQLGGDVEVYVIGVARDVCVKGAVEGMLDPLRGVPVTLVTDATWGLGIEPEVESLRRWTDAGAALVTTRGLAMRAAQGEEAAFGRGDVAGAVEAAVA
ncbi:MAG TPA: hypothetical protein VFZ20_16460, partial [Longimicrobium sp.]